MNIHAIAHNNIHAFAITESAVASAAPRWGCWKRLLLVRFDLTTSEQVAKELNKGGHCCQMAFYVLRSFEQDERNTGPKSGYGKALDALHRTLIDEAGATVKQVEGNRLAVLTRVVREARLDQELPAATAKPQRVRF